MFDFAQSPVPVREDLKNTYQRIWNHFAEPGPVLDAAQRSTLLASVRAGAVATTNVIPPALGRLASTLYTDPAAVSESTVRNAAEETGDAAAAETVGLVALLSAVDGAHRALGVDLVALPEPLPGPATGNIATGLKRRRTHLPMPPDAIPGAIDLVPEVAAVYRDSFGPQYMTEQDMALSDFERSPGLNRAQIELVSSRTSLINECFY
ncbi:hypothetical protein BMS3Bbin02_01216 [bacterium BMS3Bbin02]|nr:hypothetical protein BMS3Bbin02_01216 [bacterium BMS3Bbin02]